MCLFGGGKFKHGISEDTFANAAQTSCTKFIFYGFFDHEIENILFNRELDALEFEEFLVR